VSMAAASAANDGGAFQRQLIGDLRRDVERLHLAAAPERARNEKPADYYFPYLLAGITSLHARTGDAALLTWAKEDLLWITRCSIDAKGEVVPFFGANFRFLPALCDAYLYLKSRGALTAGEAREVAAQITASAE